MMIYKFTDLGHIGGTGKVVIICLVMVDIGIINDDKSTLTQRINSIMCSILACGR